MAVALVILPGAVAIASRAGAQQLGAELVGSWRLVAVDIVLPDGNRVHQYGDNPQGMLTFDAKGHYTLEIMRAGRPNTVPTPSTGGSTAHGEVEWKRVD